MSAMFDYITGKAQGTEAELRASLEHALGHLGTEIEEGARLRDVLRQICEISSDPTVIELVKRTLGK